MPWTALVGALILLMAGLVMALYEEQLYQTQRVREAREEAEILAASETAALSFKDRKAAEEYVDSVEVNPEIEAVGVYTSDGAPLAGFVRGGAAPVPRRLLQAEPPKLENERVVITTPVVQQATALGMVYLRARAEPMVNRVLREAVLALLVVMAVIVIAGLGSAQARLQRQAQRIWRKPTAACIPRWKSVKKPKRRCGKARRWRPSASSPAPSRTTSTISS